jgi:hypothetical protein
MGWREVVEGGKGIGMDRQEWEEWDREWGETAGNVMIILSYYNFMKKKISIGFLLPIIDGVGCACLGCGPNKLRIL